MGFRAFLWIIVAVIMVLAELSTMGLTTIWFAGGALAAMVLELMKVPMIWQLICFAVVSVLLFLLTRPLAVKYINKDREHTNADRLIGSICIVEEEINNIESCGRVKVGGQVWTARAKDEETIIHIGERVRICEISGVKLIVEREKTDR